MSKINGLRFDGEIIYCGLDVHKNNWKVHAQMKGTLVARFSQNPDPLLLKQYFERKYPGAQLQVAYEAGFCGFGIQRSLTAMGINCIVVNAADVASSDKDRKRKDDKRDARKICVELANKNLKGIYIPDPLMEHARSLLRRRHQLVKDQSRSINQIKHLMMYHGLKIQAASERMSEKYLQQLHQANYHSPVLKQTLHFAIEQYRKLREINKAITQAVRQLSQQQPFAELQKKLQSVQGIGLISGMVIQTEIIDMNRFKTFDGLCDYVGLVPDIYSSNEKMVVKGISARGNKFIKDVLIECSWMLIRKDPAMLMKYNEYKRRMNANKAIIRIAKHLLARVRHLWKNDEPYNYGVIRPAPDAFYKAYAQEIK